MIDVLPALECDTGSSKELANDTRRVRSSDLGAFKIVDSRNSDDRPNHVGRLIVAGVIASR